MIIHPQRFRWLSIVLVVALSLTIGFAATLCMAWKHYWTGSIHTGIGSGMGITSEVVPSWYLETHHKTGVWSTIAAATWDQDSLNHRVKAKGYKVDKDLQPIAGLASKDPNPIYKENFEVVQVATGFPAPALYWERYMQHSDGFNSPIEKEWMSAGINKGMHKGQVDVYFNKYYVIPILPIWRGIILDTLFFASPILIFYLIKRITPIAIRMIRKARNHCQTCGYDLRGSTNNTCPECGAKRDNKGKKLKPLSPAV